MLDTENREGSTEMSLSSFVRFLVHPADCRVWVALQGSSVQGQQRGGTPQTDKLQPVNSGANPYRVIRNWAQAPREGRGAAPTAWPSTATASPCGRPTDVRREPRPGCLGTKANPVHKFDESGKEIRSFGGGDVRVAARHPRRSRRKCVGDGRASAEPGRRSTSFLAKKTREAWSSSSAPKARSS